MKLWHGILLTVGVLMVVGGLYIIRFPIDNSSPEETPSILLDMPPVKPALWWSVFIVGVVATLVKHI